jgi:ABC-type multidrug transport system permease subunit
MSQKQWEVIGWIIAALVGSAMYVYCVKVWRVPGEVLLLPFVFVFFVLMLRKAAITAWQTFRRI